MRYSEFTLTLDEVNMSPSALKDFIKSDLVQNMKMGFEAEMIVPNLENQNYLYFIDDYSNDPPFPTKNYHDKVLNFLHNNGRVSEGITWISDRLDKLQNDYDEYVDDQFFHYIFSELDGIKLFRDNIGKVSGTTDPDRITYIIDQQLRPYYDLIIDIMRDKFKPPKKFADFLKQKNIKTIGDFAHIYSIRWPYRVKELNGRMSIEDLAQNFKQATGFNAVASQEYHTTERKSGLWIFEPDGSIVSPKESGGIELISPPMEVPQGLNALDSFWNWASSNKITANASCGFHVGVSLPSQTTDDLDPVKLILFLGDDYVLNVFGRASNEYAESTFKKLKKKAENFQEDEWELIQQLKNGINSTARNVINKYIEPKRGDHYLSINIRDTYVEFRAAGGNYFESKDKILNTIFRYIRAMNIAADPEAEKKEYAKKLYKILSSENIINKDAMFYFTQYATGQISKRDLKYFIKTQRKLNKNKNI